MSNSGLREGASSQDHQDDSEGRASKRSIFSSGLSTITIIILVLLIAAIGWREHIQGQFASLKRELKVTSTTTPAPIPLPGGQEPIVLERSPLEGGTVPELLKVTFLPGRGMELLQIKAHLPGKGEVNLLDSTTVDEAEETLSGKDADSTGAKNLSMGGALTLPWAGAIYGSPAGGSSLNATWAGHSLRLPAERVDGVARSFGGLLLKTPAKSSQINVMPDGGEARATYNAGSFDGRWPSKTEVTVTAQLSEHALEMKITARNTGDVPEPIGIGWEPRFAVLGGRRENVKLHVPSASRLEKNESTGEPTGKLLPVAETRYDFNARAGARLGETTLDDTFANLRQASLDNGPVVELIDPLADYGLRMTLLSPTIKALHVSSPAESRFIVVAPRFNYDDPFGREWGRDSDTGMVVLQPGQSAQWRVRVEIFLPSSAKF